MSDLRELYQEIILDHNKSPRNFKKLPEASRAAEGYNPLCGDHYHLYVDLDGETIRDIGFEGSGCAISKASASVMTQLVKGKKKEEAEKMFHDFRAMVTGEVQTDEAAERLGAKLAAFSGVCEFPSRVKCAILAWHTLSSALNGEDRPVSTE
ncbi:MAG TPA: SUF system NifU family Fe-S cluster assembly protein [Thermoanaerobaculia bacterium]|nr:SUF system NifU family Fe-S cluster assembly protein [Thermoanaerobaculia bacterium]